MPLDFEKFAVSAIKSIDELRSTNADPKKLDNNSTKQVESRINAFYRAVGLPAFVTNEDIRKSDPKNLNNGNFHETDPENQQVKDFIDDAEGREIAFPEELTEQQQLAFLDDMEETILSSLKKFNEGGRTKGGLFPMVVNGNIRITPNEKRVDGAFFSKQKKHNGITYRRPLIELIVLLRLRTKGFVKDTDRKKLQESFKDLKDSGFFDNGGENLLTIEILKKLLETIVDPEGIVKFIYSTVNKLGIIRKQVRETFKDSKDARIAKEQPLVGESDGKGKLEQQKAQKEQLKSEGEALITLLEYDDTIDVNIVSGEVLTRNMKDALFAPMILETLLSDTNEVDKTIEEEEEKKKKLDRLHKKLYKNMDLVLGTYSGISGIDVLAVITALFSIEEQYLLGLLNKESLERLAKLKGTTTANLPSHADVFDSINALQSKTEEIFNILNERAEKVIIKDKTIRNEG